MTYFDTQIAQCVAKGLQRCQLVGGGQTLRLFRPADELAAGVCLFRNGPNQTPRISCDLELGGDKAIIRREGNRFIIELENGRLLAVLADLQPLIVVTAAMALPQA